MKIYEYRDGALGAWMLAEREGQLRLLLRLENFRRLGARAQCLTHWRRMDPTELLTVREAPELPPATYTVAEWVRRYGATPGWFALPPPARLALDATRTRCPPMNPDDPLPLPDCAPWDPRTDEAPTTRRLRVPDLFKDVTIGSAVKALRRVLAVAAERPATTFLLLTTHVDRAAHLFARLRRHAGAPRAANLWILARLATQNVYGDAQRVMAALQRIPGVRRGIVLRGPVQEPSILPVSAFTPRCTVCRTQFIVGGPPPGTPCAFETAGRCDGTVERAVEWVILDHPGVWGGAILLQALDAGVPVLALDSGPAGPHLPQQWPPDATSPEPFAVIREILAHFARAIEAEVPTVTVTYTPPTPDAPEGEWRLRGPGAEVPLGTFAATAPTGFPVVVCVAPVEEWCVDATALEEGLKRVLRRPSTHAKIQNARTETP